MFRVQLLFSAGLPAARWGHGNAPRKNEGAGKDARAHHSVYETDQIY